jgi:hypothetical protein
MRRALLFLVALLGASTAQAGIHTWRVNEVFSNADGTIQYIELLEIQPAGTGSEVGIDDSNVTSNTESHSWMNAGVTAPTGQKHLLIATAGFAALPGAPAPDVTLPGGVVPFFSAASDVITIVPDSCTVTAAPTDGINAYDCNTQGSVINTPTNLSGATGTVDASGPQPVPTMSLVWAGTLTLVLMSAAAWLHSQRRRLRA